MYMHRNRCINKSSSKEMKKAEAKVLVIYCWYVILGIGTALGYSLSSAILDDLQRKLVDYFECERCGVISGQTCDRSGFERYTNPPMVTIAYSLFHAYPLITLIYVFRIKRRPSTKQVLPDITSSLWLKFAMNSTITDQINVILHVCKSIINFVIMYLSIL